MDTKTILIYATQWVGTVAVPLIVTSVGIYRQNKKDLGKRFCEKADKEYVDKEFKLRDEKWETKSKAQEKRLEDFKKDIKEDIKDFRDDMGKRFDLMLEIIKSK